MTHAEDPTNAPGVPADQPASAAQADGRAQRAIPARRLLIAGVLILALAIASVAFLPEVVAVLTPQGAAVAFLAILASAILTAAPSATDATAEQNAADADRHAACPFGCGCGPRPVGERTRVARLAHSNRPAGRSGLHQTHPRHRHLQGPDTPGRA
ncbi:MAG: hypothetical protein KatS3mg103_0887 [Phycisphaerales bacterium]|nr:MAG: hypothetical protein KatS3mg103_0887 [Phycisphaerales bacterium]